MIEIKATGDTTLHTAGKYCTEDILVKVPASGSSDGGAGIPYPSREIIIRSTKEASITYSRSDGGVMQLETATATYYSGMKKYQVIISDVVLNTPIFVKSDGTVTVTGSSVLPTLVVEGATYHVYTVSEGDSGDSGDSEDPGPPTS